MVFHSATDKADLYSTAPKLPIFLSLIVNYNGALDCELAIAIESTEQIVTRTKSSWRLKGLKIFNKANNVTKKVVPKQETLIIHCDCSYEETQPEWFMDQLEALKNKPKQRFAQAGFIVTTNKPAAVPVTTYRAVMDRFADLITLGEAKDGTTSYYALNNLDEQLTVSQVPEYKKAFKTYFMDYWIDMTLSRHKETDDIEMLAITAIRQFLGHHEKMWITKQLTIAINELEAEYNKLWAV